MRRYLTISAAIMLENTGDTFDVMNTYIINTEECIGSVIKSCIIRAFEETQKVVYGPSLGVEVTLPLSLVGCFEGNKGDGTKLFFKIPLNQGVSFTVVRMNINNGLKISIQEIMDNPICDNVIFPIST